MTAKQFKAKAERIFKANNPTAKVEKWLYCNNRSVISPTGLRCMNGSFIGSAPGCRSSIVIATWDIQSGMSVRT